jgi:YesN/AraC family two-component response regulator
MPVNRDTHKQVSAYILKDVAEKLTNKAIESNYSTDSKYLQHLILDDLGISLKEYLEMEKGVKTKKPSPKGEP